MYILPFPRSDVDLEAEPPISKKLKAEKETDFSVISLARGEIEEVCESHDHYYMYD